VLFAVSRDAGVFCQPVRDYMTSRLERVAPDAPLESLLPIFDRGAELTASQAAPVTLAAARHEQGADRRSGMIVEGRASARPYQTGAFRE